MIFDFDCDANWPSTTNQSQYCRWCAYSSPPNHHPHPDWSAAVRPTKTISPTKMSSLPPSGQWRQGSMPHARGHSHPRKTKSASRDCWWSLPDEWLPRRRPACWTAAKLAFRSVSASGSRALAMRGSKCLAGLWRWRWAIFSRKRFCYRLCRWMWVLRWGLELFVCRSELWLWIISSCHFRFV